MAKKYLDDTGLSHLWSKLKDYFQVKLVSGTNIKTINNTSLLGSGNISISSGSSYSAGTGLSLSSNTFNHSNSVTAGTIGTSSATSGSTLAVPYATYDSEGHITAKGTHTHTVTGFVPTSRTVNGKALSANITLSASDVSALANTGGQVSGDITLYQASGDSPSLIFQRGTLTDNYNDWRIYNTGGYLHFQQRGQNSTSWTDIAYIGSNGVIYGNGSGLSGIPAVGDTAWKTLTTDFNYVKRSGIVFVDFYKTNQSLSTSWTTIGTLPSGYRPNHNLYGAAMTLTTTPIAYFINSSSGVVQMRTATGSGSYVTAFSVSYPVL